MSDNIITMKSVHDTQKALRAAVQLFTKGRFKESTQIIDAVLALHPNHVFAIQLKGMLVFELGDPQKAAHFFEKALSINPSDGA